MGEDFYQILGVSKDATQEEIKKAYRRLARKHHPDINPGNAAAEQKFKDISRAYDGLKDEERRKRYDEFGEDGLQAGFDAQKARAYKQWQSHQPGGGQRSWEQHGRYGGYEDFFGDLFGFGGGGPQSSRTFSSKGRDMEHDMAIDLISALKGFDTQLSIQKRQICSACNGTGYDPHSKITTCSACNGSGRINVAEGPLHFTKPCPNCRGHGQVGTVCTRCGGSGVVVGTERIKVTIPPGVKDGSRVRVAGKGEPGVNNGPSGDLYLVIRVKPHDHLTRKGDDLYMDVPVTVHEALAGGDIIIPTVDGQVNLKIPPTSQSGQILRLKGQGAVNPKTGERGDLKVKLIVKIPRSDKEEVRKAAAVLNQYYQEDLRKNIRL
jgi:molecular chaperone DnaJ